MRPGSHQGRKATAPSTFTLSIQRSAIVFIFKQGPAFDSIFVLPGRLPNGSESQARGAILAISSAW